MDRLDHDLIDAGDGRRLDRFGTRLIDRPALGASLARRDPGAWAQTEARFTPGGWFAGPGLQSPRIDGPAPWQVEMGPLVFELQLWPSGQVGLFPEHALGLPWLLAQAAATAAHGAGTAAHGAGTVAHGAVPGRGRRAIEDGPARDDEDAAAGPVRVLNLFAHTGLVTLALAAAGAAVTHLDGSRPAVAQARRNASRSGLADRPVRWIVDDAVAFARRESRRRRTYHGVIVDPPAFGHAGNRTWQLEDGLDELLAAVAGVLDPARGFVLLTAHSRGAGPELLGDALADALGRSRRQVETGRLSLVARSGARLESGAFARTVVGRGAPRADADR